MRCTDCGQDNITGARFCEHCGTRMARCCPGCGQVVSPTARFCNACGIALEDAAPEALPAATTAAPIHYTPPHLAQRILAEQSARQARGGNGGERKTITVLFADMTGSTALIQDLDPEEARRLIDPVLELMMEAVHHYEGYVAKSLGDGILALFGAPIAHEDHPRRALYAALRMQETIRHHSDRLRLEQGIALQVRVGIHSGEVVVREIRTDDLHTDYDPVGNTINIAARMEGIATPGTILVSEASHRLTEGYFNFKPLGETRIKGLSEPLAVYELQGLGALRTRLEVAAHRGLARFVGRRGEMVQLQQALDKACSGQGQIVGVVGEPGVGKSRLYYEFKHRAQQSCRVLETFSVSHGKAFACLPLIELLKNYLQIGPKDDERQRREKITGKVLTLDRSLEGSLPYLFYLLGVTEADSALRQMDGQVRRQRTFEAIRQLLVHESLDQPLVLIFEDLQWLDRETEAFLRTLSDGVPAARMLLLVNYRPEYQHDWGQKSCYTQLRLDPLGPIEAQELLAALLGDDASLAALKPLIMTQTEGNPFFLEEVVQTLVEEGVLSGSAGNFQLQQAPADLHIPTTVQGVLSARIDRLAMAEKALLQTLAVIGKDFPWSLVQQVVGPPDDDLKRGLSRLQAGEFLYERPAFPEVEYTFKHGLTQEVAYGSLLQERRSRLHERTAQAIETLFSASLDDRCSELAHHYSCSGNAGKAVEYLLRAADQAMHRSASKEALAHLRQAQGLLPALPDTSRRAELELQLEISLGHVWMAVRGFGATEVETSFTRAMTLARELGDSKPLFSALVALRRFYTLRADFGAAQAMAEQLLVMAQAAADPALLVQAHAALGATSLFRGQLNAAQKHCDQVLALYDAHEHASHAFVYGIEPGILGRIIGASTLWFRGFPDQALRRCLDALELAQEVPNPYTLADPMIFRAELHHQRGEVSEAREWAESVIELATEQGFPYWHARASILRGWALVEQGASAEGIGIIRQGMQDYQATGGEFLKPYFMALLADALGKAGQEQEALTVLDEALDCVKRTGEHLYTPELYRLKGLLQRQQPEVALNYLQQAIALAAKQGSRSLELRAAVDLARLLSGGEQGAKRREALELLASRYSLFDEGFDSTDLLAARTLLEQLSQKTDAN
uniref:adenylate/guanylate cyclase domain-containing protein n=1 Tax=Marinobacterium profundum TaxID=1714300 RepID=UPI00082AC2A7|nr:adenylate/guanylate cyclase domain-containing protein [Marinobacterium profundum]